MYFSIERSVPFFQRNSSYPGAIQAILDIILLESNTFIIYVQTAFIHTTPRAISSGTLSDGYNHDRLIKLIDDDDDEDDDDNDDGGGDGDDNTHHFLKNHLMPAPLLCPLSIFSFNPCKNSMKQLLLVPPPHTIYRSRH